MIKVIESEDVIEVQSNLPIGQRVLFVLLALVPLLAPYELIIRPKWQSYLNLFFLFVAVISFGALVVSAFFVWAAIAGLDSKLRFDKAAGMLTYSVSAPILRWRTERYPVESLATMQVEIHDWSDGSPSYSLVAVMADGRSLKSGSSWSREEIEAIVQRVTSFLAR